MGETDLFSLAQVCDHPLFPSIFQLPSSLTMCFTLVGGADDEGLMDHCMSREKLVYHLKERVEAAEMEWNELKALWEVQVKKLNVTRKALEESET